MQRGDYKLLQQIDADNQWVGVLGYKLFCACFVMVACLRHAAGVVYGVLLGPTQPPTLHCVWCGVSRMSCLRHDGGAWCAVPSLFVTKSFVGDNGSCLA